MSEPRPKKWCFRFLQSLLKNRGTYNRTHPIVADVRASHNNEIKCCAKKVFHCFNNPSKTLDEKLPRYLCKWPEFIDEVVQ